MEEKCRLCLELDTGEGLYRGGDGLKGLVSLELEEAVEIVGIELHLYGGTFVKWCERRSEEGDQTVVVVEHTAEEIHFNETFMLWGQARGVGVQTEQLSCGRHMFPFNVKLPEDLPSSFEGHFGWVRYYAQVTVLKPSPEDFTSSQTFFAVIKDLNLNEEKVFFESLQERKETVLRATCCKAGRITSCLNVPRSGFVPGEKLQADVDIANISPRKVKATCLVLKQLVTYGTSSNKTRQTTLELCRIPGDKVKPGRSHCWTCKNIEIPPVPPSTLDGCKFLNISYELSLHVDLHPVSTIVSLPIIIGTVPLKESLFTSWVYQSQFVSTIHKPQPWLAPDGSTHALPEDQINFLPRYKFFSMCSPVTPMVTLESSPGERRKRVFILEEQHRQAESYV